MEFDALTCSLPALTDTFLFSRVERIVPDPDDFWLFQALASLGEGEVHDQTKFGVQAAVSAAFGDWFRRWVELSPGVRERASGSEICWELRVELGEAGCEDPAVGLGEQDGDTPAERGELVAVSAGAVR